MIRDQGSGIRNQGKQALWALIAACWLPLIAWAADAAALLLAPFIGLPALAALLPGRHGLWLALLALLAATARAQFVFALLLAIGVLL